jgi:hypothetical protein
VAQHVPKDDGGINVSAGEVNVNASCCALGEILDKQKTRCNFYQLEKLITLFGNAWGFHITTVNSSFIVS